MNLPTVEQSEQYSGLYVFDFGDWVALGYTAEEIAVLLESEQYRSGHVYKIVRATPAGQMELRGVAPERFQFESGMFFNRDSLEAARADFDQLKRAAQRRGTPGRTFLHLADRGRHEGVPRYLTALIYPAEYEDEMARWLSAADYAGGDTVEGGISHVTNYYDQQNLILDRQQLWSRPAIPSRCPDEVLGSVRQAVQRQVG